MISPTVRRLLPAVRLSKRRPSTPTTRTSIARGISTTPGIMEGAKDKPAYSIVTIPTNFEERIANRSEFDHARATVAVTKSPNPAWQYGRGATRRPDAAAAAEDVKEQQQHKEIDPYGPDRSVVQNYKLLISAIAPRPIGFLSTVSADQKTKNLAPFSYFQLVEHNPPMFVVSFSSRQGPTKDTYRNLRETGEVVINTVSEDMIEAVSASSIDAPYGVSEWDITGLHEAPTTTVRPSRVEESVMSIEGVVVDIKEFDTHGHGMSAPGLVLIKATRFWVRRDAANEDFSHIDINSLRPIAQLGGMAYGIIRDTFELPRTRWTDEQPKSKFLTELEEQAKKT